MTMHPFVRIGIVGVISLAMCSPRVQAQSLFGWWPGRNSNVVNVYVPPGSIGPTVPAGTVPAATVPVGTMTTAKPIVVYQPPIQTTAPATTVPLSVPGAVAAPAAVPGSVAAPGVPVPAATAAGYTVQYRVTTRYRTRWVQVPVTVYRPVTTVDPVTGTRRTMPQPCQSYTWQVRRVPVAQWRPIRVLQGPPPAGSIPTITMPSASAVAPAATTVTVPAANGWPVVSGPRAAAPPLSAPPALAPSTTPAPTYSTAPLAAPQYGQPPAAPPQPNSYPANQPPAMQVPSIQGGAGADERPRITPSEAQHLTKPPADADSSRTRGGTPHESQGSNETQSENGEADRHDHDTDGPQINAPANAASSSNRNVSPLRSLGPPPGLKPIPREVDDRAKPANTPAKPPAAPQPVPRSPLRLEPDLEEPPQLLDPRDALVRRSKLAPVTSVSWKSTRTAASGHKPVSSGTSRQRPQYSSSGWFHVELN